MIRPNWDSAMVSDSIIMVLLGELGYTVDDASRAQGVAPDLTYKRLALGHSDVTFEAWMPGHRSWFDGILPAPDGRSIGELLTVVEPPLQPAGGLQGFLVTKSWAEAEGITHVGQISNDPALAAALDSDGNGLGEIYGCPEDWTCDDIIEAFVRFNEWDSLEQWRDLPRRGRSAVGGYGVYEAMFDDFLARVDRGEPAIAYTWTPTRYYADARVGENTIWLSVTNEAALNGTRYLHDDPYTPSEDLLNPDGSAGFGDLPDDICTQGPDGCQIGWAGGKIHAVANSEWLDANPVAGALLEAIDFETAEVSQLVSELEQLELEAWPDKIDASMSIAHGWVDDNPNRVNAWLDAALDRSE